MSCVAISNTVVEKVDLNKFHYAQSHQNDPLGASIAKEVLDIIEKEKLLERAVEIGKIIQMRLLGIREKFGIIKEVRCRGLMIAIEFQKNEKISLAQCINEKLLEKNIILVKRPGHEVFRIDPALTIDMKDVEYFLNSLEDIIREVKSIELKV